MRRLLVALAVISLAVGAAGCGEKEESLDPGSPEPLELMLDFFPNADHAAIYAAQAGGHFEDVGLDVQIRQPPDPAAPLKQVVAGRADLAISYEPEVLRARDDGLAVHAVGALVQVPLTSIISLPEAGIRQPEDLDGKVVGTAGIDYQTAYLEAIAKRAGAKVEEQNVGFNLSGALLAKKVDASLGAFWNYEGTDLRLRGKDPQIIRIEQAGVPTYDELVLVANADKEDDRIKRFMAALERGVDDLERDPDRALKGLLDANPDLDPKLQREVLDVTLPLFQAPGGKPFGYQDPREWNEFARWMRDNELLDEPDRRRGRLHERVPAGRRAVLGGAADRRRHPAGRPARRLVAQEHPAAGDHVAARRGPGRARRARRSRAPRPRSPCGRGRPGGRRSSGRPGRRRGSRRRGPGPPARASRPSTSRSRGARAGAARRARARRGRSARRRPRARPSPAPARALARGRMPPARRAHSRRAPPPSARRATAGRRCGAPSGRSGGAGSRSRARPRSAAR